MASMSATDELVANNEAYAASFARRDSGKPAPKVAVLACMDSRLDPVQVLGLRDGEAHVIRNGGGVVTEDAIRSLVISQRLLGTEEIVLIHHTDCGMVTFRDEDVSAAIEDETGIRPPFAFEAFQDVEESLRQSIAKIISSPFIPRTDHVRGFVYDVDTGRLREVS
jgi:carbonic anhydrase